MRLCDRFFPRYRNKERVRPRYPSAQASQHLSSKRVCFFIAQVRLGGDSQQTFGHCALCIHPAVEPMATPSGHIYCKECIVEFLLAKTQELKRQREAFEEQEKNKGA